MSDARSTAGTGKPDRVLVKEMSGKGMVGYTPSTSRNLQASSLEVGVSDRPTRQRVVNGQVALSETTNNVIVRRLDC